MKPAPGIIESKWFTWQQRLSQCVCFVRESGQTGQTLVAVHDHVVVAICREVGSVCHQDAVGKEQEYSLKNFSLKILIRWCDITFSVT